jgi:hypothetical protein
MELVSEFPRETTDKCNMSSNTGGGRGRGRITVTAKTRYSKTNLMDLHGIESGPRRSEGGRTGALPLWRD